AGAAAGSGRLAGAVPPILVCSCGCAGAPPGPHAHRPIKRRARRKQMSSRDAYSPGPAEGALVQKEGDNWTLVLVRELRHSPEKVWQALTDPGELREWAPFDADRNLGAVGPVKLTTVGAPTPNVSETQVTRAEA